MNCCAEFNSYRYGKIRNLLNDEYFYQSSIFAFRIEQNNILMCKLKKAYHTY